MVIRVKNKSAHIFRILVFTFLVFAPFSALAQETGSDSFLFGLTEDPTAAIAPENISTSMGIVFLITVISLAPAILLLTTSFTRIIVVLGFLRQAMATQQTPPNQVLVGLALFLTMFIMTPTYQQVYDNALLPYMNGEIVDGRVALEEALKPIRDFMFLQTRSDDILLFLNIAEEEVPDSREEISIRILIPAFILSELTTAFMMGFVIYIPFLIIDMVVASTLMAMGMMMLPPIFVSLPFKIIVFVLADGWRLLIGSLTRSFYP